MNAQPKHSSPNDIRSRWKIIDGGRDKPKQVWVVCPGCYGIRLELEHNDACRECSPPRYGKIRFRSRELAERYVRERRPDLAR